MSTDNDGEQNVDRGDDYTPPADAGKQQESPGETNADKDDGLDADLKKAQEGEEGKKDGEEGKKAADGDDDGKNRDEKGRFIPKERFDEAVQRERRNAEAAQARVVELEKAAADREIAADMQKAQEKLGELSKEHSQLISDGELDKAAEKMTEMLNLQSEMQAQQSAAHAAAVGAQTKDEVQYDAVVARLEVEYPEINPDDTENFDRDAVRRVQAYMTGLIQMEKMAPGKALQESVTTILGAKRAEENKDDRQKEKDAEELGMRRQEAAVKKGMEAEEKQPPDAKDVGQDHDKEGGALDAAAVMKMSWEDFVKLPEEELSKMRGDHIA